MQCRSCDAPLEATFCDLGMSPMANSYLPPEALGKAESFYPLHAYVCSNCLLVQLLEFESPDAIFSDYAYFSSYSSSWVDHAKRYVEAMIPRFGLGADNLVVEIASNDGYLLQHFVANGVPVLGIEPAANVAAVAQERGIHTDVAFFGTSEARRQVAAGVRADLLIGNNVLAHVPDLNDFVAGLAVLLAPDGRITIEFPHLLQLILHSEFDTIYHEHFSYFSLIAVRTVFARHGLRIFDVEEQPTHGGSLRIFACHDDDAAQPNTPHVDALLEAERAAGLDRLETYSDFAAQVLRTKRSLWRFFDEAIAQGKTVVAYGAPAKGNTLLNFCGVGADMIAYTVDRSPYKQGFFLPGTHIPIHAPEHIAETRPDYLLILPWNLRDEIISDMAHIREWGGQFVLPIPEVEIVS
ncbi:MAG: SAM-dependent methyltransferase [Ilumatobacteraceae bacterium]|nr:SAM-dependent methyltransferase [Ilumatobacteraceae bacterium]